MSSKKNSEMGCDSMNTKPSQNKLFLKNLSPFFMNAWATFQ